MDPYLESPAHWSDLHHRLIDSMSEVVSERLPANYFARINELVMMIQPDPESPRAAGSDVLVMRDPLRTGGGVAVAPGASARPYTLANVESLDPHTEGFIEIIRLRDHEVVSVIELFSPTNKLGDGRGLYGEAAAPAEAKGPRRRDRPVAGRSQAHAEQAASRRRLLRLHLARRPPPRMRRVCMERKAAIAGSADPAGAARRRRPARSGQGVRHGLRPRQI